jgi:succinate dehydrogenase/fumarate reductase cytochrome b subunit
MSLRTLHALAAAVLTLFASAHIANHLVALAGAPAHIAFMEAARAIYRHPVCETLLLACVAMQIITGAALVRRGWKSRRGRIPWLQAISGTYLAFFLMVHVGAVMTGRALGLDTNFYFAAAGFQVPLLRYFFLPYYGLAVIAFFCHLACAGYWLAQGRSRPVRRLAFAAPLAFGLCAALLILLCLDGLLIRFEVPGRYLEPYGKLGLIRR